MRYLPVVVVVVMLAVSIWARVDAPCSTFRYSSVQHVPARCVQGVLK